MAKIFGKATPGSIERTYANNFTYSPDGKIERLRLGSGVWQSAKFNSRLQVTELSVGWGPTSGSIWKMTTEYGEWNGTTVDAAKNSGNIGKQTVSFSGLTQPFVQSFSYDALQRLTEAKETNNGNQTWREVFDYDRYGNRTTHNKFIGTNEVPQTDETRPEIDAAKNRFKPTEGYTFDANRNIVVDFNGRQFTFNGDNKQTQVKDSQNNVIGTYFFDGEGKRVKKVVGAETTIFVYSGGKLIAEYTTETPPQNPTTRFTITDQLGSPRVILDSAGDVVSRRDFLPFGEEIDPDITYRTDALKYGREDKVRQKFTGYQSDEETGLDFAEARMYENRHGRFTAVDPSGNSVNPQNPQSWNRFPYCYNNPLTLVDENGQWPVPTHVRRTIESFTGLSRKEMAAVVSGAVLTDAGSGGKPFSTYWPSEARKHSVTEEGLTPEQGKEKTQEYLNGLLRYVQSEQKRYEAAGGEGISLKALVAIGEASHTYQDAASPMHGHDKIYGLPMRSVSVTVLGSTYTLGYLDSVKFLRDQEAHNDGESHEPPPEAKAFMNLRSRAFFLLALGPEHFKKLRLSDKESKEVKEYVEQLARPK